MIDSAIFVCHLFYNQRNNILDGLMTFTAKYKYTGHASHDLIKKPA